MVKVWFLAPQGWQRMFRHLRLTPWAAVAIELDGMVFEVNPRAGVMMRKSELYTNRDEWGNCIILRPRMKHRALEFLREQLSKPAAKHQQPTLALGETRDEWHSPALVATAIQRAGVPLILPPGEIDVASLWNALPKLTL